MAKLKNNNTEKYLRHFAEGIIRKGKKILKAKKKDVSGKLLDSLRYRLHAQEGGGYKLFFKSTDYGEFVDKGVSGTKVRRMYTTITGTKKKSPFSYTNKQPPTSVLDQWIIRKGLVPRTKTGQFKPRTPEKVGFKKSLAFLIARSIKSKGLKGTNFYSDPLSKAFTTSTKDNFAVQFLSAWKKDIILYFENLKI